MIRFACPGCQAPFSVDDSKAGKSGKCPKCQTQFVIPEAESSVAYKPSADADGPVEIDPCPKCQTKLSVAASDIGNDVECPYCKTVFASTAAGTRPTGSSSAGRKSSADLESPGRPKPRSNRDEDEDEPPRRRRSSEDDDEDDRPSRRGRASKRDDDEEEERRPSRKRSSRRDDDDDDDDDRPRRKRKRRSSRGSSGAASSATTLGVIGLFVWCCPIAGLVVGGLAITKGNEALVETDGAEGNGAVIMGYIAVTLSILNIIAGIIMKVAQ